MKIIANMYKAGIPRINPILLGLVSSKEQRLIGKWFSRTSASKNELLNPTSINRRQSDENLSFSAMIKSSSFTYAQVAKRTLRSNLKTPPYLTGQQLLDLARSENQGPITRSITNNRKSTGSVHSPPGRAGKTRPVGVALRVQHYMRHKEAADRHLRHAYAKFRLGNPKPVLDRAEMEQLAQDIEVRSNPEQVYRENCCLSWICPRRAQTPPPPSNYGAALMYRFISDCEDSIKNAPPPPNLETFQQMQIDEAGPSTSRQ